MPKIFILLSLFLSPLFIKAQYSHKLEISFEYKNSNEYARIIDYPIMNPVLNNSRYWIINTGGSAVNYAIAYQIENIPVQIVFKGSSIDYNQQSRETYVLDKLDISQFLQWRKYGLELRYVFYEKSIVSPYISVGINKNFINYKAQRNIILYNINDGIIEVKDSYVDDYYLSFKSVGFAASTGIKIRIFDCLGVFAYINHDFLLKNKIFPPEKYINLSTLNAGIYYRAFKRKKY